MRRSGAGSRTLAWQGRAGGDAEREEMQSAPGSQLQSLSALWLAYQVNSEALVFPSLSWALIENVQEAHPCLGVLLANMGWDVHE